MKKKTLSLILSIVLMFNFNANVSAVSLGSIFSESYSIKSESINSEIRTEGTLIRTIMPNFTNGFFSLANFFLDNFGKGLHLSNKINMEKIYITRDDGSELRLCVYTPKIKKENVPGLLWIHGGGFAIGIPEQDISFIESFVVSSGCVVVAPDYINSTDRAFPGAFDDCYNSLLWLRDNGEKYGMREDQIFVGGNSAGGGLCAAVTLKARDTGDVKVAFQMPLYPMLDDRMITKSSQNNDAPVWNTKSNEIAWKLYLGDNYGTDNVSKYAAPSRETDYSNLPPTLIYIGTIEPFYDETLIYAENLKRAGVTVQIKEFEGCFHGFDLLFYTDIAKEARSFLLDGFMFAVENYFST